jgi:hypothetical protein
MASARGRRAGGLPVSEERRETSGSAAIRAVTVMRRCRSPDSLGAMTAMVQVWRDAVGFDDR